MTAIFITGTGTDIGKTYVTAGLVRYLRGEGRTVDALKPVMTGFDPARVEDSDGGVLLKALGKPLTEIERISPWRYGAPLSPDMAARQEDRPLGFDALIKFSRDAMAAATGTLLIEGVGGVMVPLDDRTVVLDWMFELDLSLLLVAGSYLGTISHTLTCLDVLWRRGLTIAALVVNESANSTVPLDDTVATLARFVGSLPIVTLRRNAANGDAFARLSALL